MAITIEREWARLAATGGLIAGSAFAAFLMVMGSLWAGADGLVMPLLHRSLQAVGPAGA